MKQCPPLSSASDPLDYYRQKKIFCNDAMELENDAMELEHDEIALRVERLGETRFHLFIVGKTKRIMRVVTLRPPQKRHNNPISAPAVSLAKRGTLRGSATAAEGREMTITAAPPRRADAPPVSPVVAEALRLLAAGLSVLPIAANGTKAPASCIASWKEFQTRRLTEAEAATMFRGNVGLAIISGAISGNLETLDFDEAGLYAQYEQAAADHGLLEFVQSLPLVETPTGGAHLRYRCAEPVAGNQKLAQKEIPGEDGKAESQDAH